MQRGPLETLGKLAVRADKRAAPRDSYGQVEGIIYRDVPSASNIEGRLKEEARRLQIYRLRTITQSVPIRSSRGTFMKWRMISEAK